MQSVCLMKFACVCQNPKKTKKTFMLRKSHKEGCNVIVGSYTMFLRFIQGTCKRNDELNGYLQSVIPFQFSSKFLSKLS